MDVDGRVGDEVDSSVTLGSGSGSGTASTRSTLETVAPSEDPSLKADPTKAPVKTELSPGYKEILTDAIADDKANVRSEIKEEEPLTNTPGQSDGVFKKRKVPVGARGRR